MEEVVGAICKAIDVIAQGRDQASSLQTSIADATTHIASAKSLSEEVQGSLQELGIASRIQAVAVLLDSLDEANNSIAAITTKLSSTIDAYNNSGAVTDAALVAAHAVTNA